MIATILYIHTYMQSEFHHLALLIKFKSSHWIKKHKQTYKFSSLVYVFLPANSRSLMRMAPLCLSSYTQKVESSVATSVLTLPYISTDRLDSSMIFCSLFFSTRFFLLYIWSIIHYCVACTFSHKAHWLLFLLGFYGFSFSIYFSTLVIHKIFPIT